MGGVKRVRIVISKSILDTLERAARDEREIEEVEYVDQQFRGLHLAVRKTKSVWLLKHRSVTKKIGEFLPINSHRRLTALSQVRELAAQVKAMVEDDPSMIDAFLAIRYADKTKSTKEVLETMRPKRGTWTLKECVDTMLEERQKEGAKRRLKPLSVADIKVTFARPEMADLMKREVVSIKRGEIEDARRKVEKAYGVSPSIKLLTHVRTVLDYCTAHHAGLSGLDGKEPWWRLLSSPLEVAARTRNPKLTDIAKTLLLAEEYAERPLPGRKDGKRGVRPGTLAAFWWIILTCQRADAATKLKSYSLIPDKNREGWYIAAWDGDLMKGGKTHFLPIPPRAYAVLQPLIKKAKNYGKGDWAFPSEVGKGDKHVTRSATLGIIKRFAARDQLLNGIDPDERPDERIDLLMANGIKYWTQHDVRRRLVKVCDDAGIPGGASRILAHELKRDERIDVADMTPEEHEAFLRQMTAEITTRAYGAAVYMKVKAEAMEAWTNALLDEYEKQKALRSRPDSQVA